MADQPPCEDDSNEVVRLVKNWPKASEADRLLEEWFTWWLESDDAPRKMPNALHIRTVMYAQRKVLNSHG